VSEGPVPAAPPPPPHAPPRTSGLAVAALACGIAGLTLLPVLASIAAVVLGIMARDELRRDPTLGGDGMATAGLVLGWIGVAFAALGVLLLVGFVLLVF
jgi:hypothetical protein